MAVSNIVLTRDHILKETDKAFLLKVPKRMYGPRYHFWVSKIFISFTGKNMWYLNVGLVENVKYRIFKNSSLNFSNILNEFEKTGKEFVEDYYSSLSA